MGMKGASFGAVPSHWSHHFISRAPVFALGEEQGPEAKCDLHLGCACCRRIPNHAVPVTRVF